MDFADFLNLIDASFIYEGGKNMAAFIAAVITPILLIVAIWIRMGQSQLETVTSGSGKWGVFLKDLAVWTTILGLYFVLAGFLSDTFNHLYDYFQKQGSLAAIQEKFMGMVEEIDNRSDDGQGFFERTFDIMGNAVTFTIWLFYYFSFLLATFLVEFLKMAHALAWSFALVWGLIAIPMSLVSNFKLLRGWAIFSGVVLCWPLFHFGGFALFNPIFEAAAKSFVSGGGAGLASIDQAQLYLIMTFVNLISVAVALAAPFVAQAFISNSGSIAGVVTPFALAATSMAGAGAMAAKGRMQGAGRAANDSVRSVKQQFSANQPTTPSRSQNYSFGGDTKHKTSELGPAANSAPNPAFNSQSNNSASTTHAETSTSTSKENAEGNTAQQPVDNHQPTPQASASNKASKVANAAMLSGTGTAATSSIDGEAIDSTTALHGKKATAKARQAKRGAVLDRAHKQGSVTLKGRKS